jgi:3-hydroxyisobutyrate dehydrogenase-like beta-hydroxyacid dehydrogenase
VQGNSYVWETEVPLVFNQTFDPDFTLALHCKDLGIGYDISKRAGEHTMQIISKQPPDKTISYQPASSPDKTIN